MRQVVRRLWNDERNIQKTILKGADFLSAKYNDIRDAYVHLPTPYITYRASLISIHTGRKSMKKNIYCPLCLKRGKKKILGRVSDDTCGTLYLWCKVDKKEMKIHVEGGNASD